MAVIGGFDNDKEFDELLNVVDTGSGAKSAATRQANAWGNLGVTNPSAAAQTAAGGVVDFEQYLILAANYTLTDANTAQKAFNTTANGALTLAAGGVYMFEAYYNITNTGTTSHTWAVTFGGTATFGTGTSYQAYGISGTAANTPAAGGLSGFFSGTNLATVVVVTAASVSATEQVAIELAGVIVVVNGGTLIPQVKLSAATTGVETMLAGSFFRIWRVGAAGAVGAWS